MAAYTRTNAWTNGGDFTNPDLYWYAVGVRAMQARQLTDSTSWWFYAAIHGEYATQRTLPQEGTNYPYWGAIIPAQYMPNPSLQSPNSYWDQCQHQSWYFPPWHRGYLLALEAQLRTDIVAAGGPSTWALPYWNYLRENTIPPAFTFQNLKLQDGTTVLNPLYVSFRYGPNGNANIFLPTDVTPPLSPDSFFGAINQDSLSNDLYTTANGDAKTTPPGFGGPSTGFLHGGGTSGNLENNPHNMVHVYVGGFQGYGANDDQKDSEANQGVMSDPSTAGLDPIFFVHHANIDRMWAVWNQMGNANPTDPNWLGSPAATGGRPFVMPVGPNGKGPWHYTPADMTSLGRPATDYTYDDLKPPAAVPSPATLLTQRLTQLGVKAGAAAVPAAARIEAGTSMELLGANQGALPIKGAGARTTVKLDAGVRDRVSASLKAASAAVPPDRVYLNLENIRGTKGASVLSVYVNLPEGGKPAEHPELLAGSVGLFGLRQATLKDGDHGGLGLSFVLDITKIVDRLHLSNALNTDSINVAIVPHRPLSDTTDIAVGRISIYRQGS